MQAERLKEQIAAQGWTRSRLIHELRKAAQTKGVALPEDDSLSRMIREWISGRRQPSEMYAELLGLVFGDDFGAAEVEDSSNALAERLEHAARIVEPGLVEMFEHQTELLRRIDRQLGAVRALDQTTAHVEQMADLLKYAPPGPARDALAAAAAEAGSLAGWQALDLGRANQAFRMYEVARTAAFESGNRRVLAHVIGESAYAFADLGKPEQAQTTLERATRELGGDATALMSTWLLCARAEVAAMLGDGEATRRLLGEADQHLAGLDDDPQPGVFLSAAHVARWRGNSLAAIGDVEAVATLQSALADHPAEFSRAEGGLRMDLAQAHLATGEVEESQAQLDQAAKLVRATGSVRQQKRLAKLQTAVTK